MPSYLYLQCHSSIHQATYVRIQATAKALENIISCGEVKMFDVYLRLMQYALAKRIFQNYSH